jgi:hypothetical protein
MTETQTEKVYIPAIRDKDFLEEAVQAFKDLGVIA